ncbi:uncharacterized protein BDZ99DRAFT_210465 [Mytilinidion resinicola]|uniref:Uncharacterized protein n=1 Tax=Mytilinidion resinicola TaxID=574789 RepID=A0A6A6Y049_9PEZI|nr:uncharacterized protein BDZ99DRAFT_210465 [Mytilinidion resinicola]KAF2802142.1 hypothetical protein BDZ99DRAFT_210465 [Mytilinidion resinicola]
MLPTPLTLLATLLLPLLATAHNVRIYSDEHCKTDLNWAGLGGGIECQPWDSWFSPGSFLLDANAIDDSTIVVFIEGKACKSAGAGAKRFQVANVTAGCTKLESWVSSMQVQNFTMDGDKKVPKVGKREEVGSLELRWEA